MDDPQPPEIRIDLGGIGDAIVAALTEHIGELGNAAWAAFSTWLYSGIHALFSALFDATLLGIPHRLTDQFAPVTSMMPNTLLIAAAGIALAMALLGLKVILQRLPIHTAVAEEIIGRLVIHSAIFGSLPWVISTVIELEQRAAASVTASGLRATTFVPPASPHDVSEIVALVVMIGLGIRLWFKLASNVVHVAVAIVWSPAAYLCGLFPSMAWVTTMWWREFIGRCAGAALAAIATTLGFALAMNFPGLLSIAAAGGAFLAAADFVDWLARTPGSGDRMGGVLGWGARSVQAGLGAAHGAAGGAAGGARPALAANQITTRAEQFGFD